MWVYSDKQQACFEIDQLLSLSSLSGRSQFIGSFYTLENYERITSGHLVADMPCYEFSWPALSFFTKIFDNYGRLGYNSRAMSTIGVTLR